MSNKIEEYEVLSRLQLKNRLTEVIKEHGFKVTEDTEHVLYQLTMNLEMNTNRGSN